MKRVLITGAAGFIGRQCLPLLLEHGYEIHATTLDTPLLDQPNVQWHQVNLLDALQIRQLIESIAPSHLLHFAWYVAPGKYWSAPENLRWVQASLELLQAFERVGGQRIVMAGSCMEYDWDYGYCSELVTPLHPRTLYGASKQALCQLLEAFAREMGLSAAWGRIFFLYGPYEQPGRLVSSVISALLREELALCSHGNQIRDFLYVKDVADAFVALLDKDVSGLVNIASGCPLSIRDFVYKIATQLGREDLVRLGALPTAPNDPPLLVADVRRLKEEVGWHPRYEIEAGIEESITWWKTRIPAL